MTVFSKRRRSDIDVATLIIDNGPLITHQATESSALDPETPSRRTLRSAQAAEASKDAKVISLQQKLKRLEMENAKLQSKLDVMGENNAKMAKEIESLRQDVKEAEKVYEGPHSPTK